MVKLSLGMKSVNLTNEILYVKNYSECHDWHDNDSMYIQSLLK